MTERCLYTEDLCVCVCLGKRHRKGRTKGKNRVPELHHSLAGKVFCTCKCKLLDN